MFFKPKLILNGVLYRFVSKKAEREFWKEYIV